MSADIQGSTYWTIFAGVASFIGKSLWDIYQTNRTRKIQLIEKQLSLFYYPLLIRFEKDNVTWRMILDKRKDDGSLQEKIGRNVEKNIILPNHDEMIRIIEEQSYLCQDEEIEKMLVQYIKHIAVYKAIREAGDEMTFPRNYDKDLQWPNGLYDKILERTRLLQRKLDQLTWK